MSNRSSRGTAPSKRIALAFAVTAFISAGSPVVAISSASTAGGAQRQVTSTFGDCKNDNSGKHYGYVCPDPTSGSGGGIVVS
jgi:hypothetical protein